MNGYHWNGDRLVLDVHIQPKARRDEIVGLHGERIKIRIAAPPVDGKANAALIQFLARQFDVPKNRVDLLSGHAGRDKRFAIHAPRKLPAPFAPAPGEPGHAR